jgi:hypothetical protein
MLPDAEHDKPLYNRTYAHLDKALCIQDMVDRVPGFESRDYAPRFNAGNMKADRTLLGLSSQHRWITTSAGALLTVQIYISNSE